MADASNLAALDKALNEAILAGDIRGAFEKFYAEDVQMQENSEPVCKGKAANRAREQAFVDSVAQIHDFKLLGSAVGDGVTYSEWMMDVTYKNGARIRSAQASARRWRDGKVTSERFYYNKS